MLCLLSCRLSWDLEVERVYPKLSSIGFMTCVSGADRVAWVITGIKGLTDVCWGIPEVDEAVDIVKGGNSGVQVGPDTWLECRRKWGLWPSFNKKPGYIPPSPKTNPRGLGLDC